MALRIAASGIGRAARRWHPQGSARRWMIRSLSVKLPDGLAQVARRSGVDNMTRMHGSTRAVSTRRTSRKPPAFRQSAAVRARAASAAESNAVAQSSEDSAPDATHDAATTQSDVVPADAAVPIDFSKAMSIEGHEAQVVHIDLEPQQCLRAETGAMIYMTDGVEMDTTTAGGLGQGFKRMMTGENFFVTRFTYRGPSKGRVALSTSFPSKIVHLRLEDFHENSVICQKGAFLCGADTINIEMEFAKKIGVGFFGGEGFILQRLTGTGDALVRASGTLIERELAPGEVLRISSGCLVAFEPSVHYDITMMKGVKNVMFGGEGLFVTTLTGPGKIYLQSLPFDRVIGEIAGRAGHSARPGAFFPFFGGGGGGSNNEAAASEDGAEPAATENAAAPDDQQQSNWNSESTDESIYGGANAPPDSNDNWDQDSNAFDNDADEESSGGFMGFFTDLFGGGDDD